MDLILASQSPRRKELLGRLGLTFRQEIADVDETMRQGALPYDEVARLSQKKAAAIAQGAPDAVIVAADTVVVLDDVILGKPHDAADAVRMLRLLSGRSHEVMTGVTVQRGTVRTTQTVVTRVHFRALREGEIAAYVATGDPLDKAGAYGIQGVSSIFVDRLDGDYYNVMGLPLCALAQMLRAAGIPILGEAS